MDSPSNSQYEIIEDNNSSDPDHIFDSDSQKDSIESDDLRLKINIDFVQTLFPTFEFDYIRLSLISFKISGSILPKTILHVNDLDRSPILLDVQIETSLSWKEKPFSISVSNPVHGNKFIGKCLIIKKIANFFSKDYHPSPFYLCQNYIITPPGRVDDESFATLLQMGFSEEESKRSLLFMHNDLESSVKFLETGINPNELKELEINYTDFPLFYLILEIMEVFFELSDHCCICGKPLDIKGIRPMVCDRDACNFCFTEIGVSSNIIGEIKRDPLANDLLISLASTTYDTKFFNPCPPKVYMNHLSHFFKNLPSMHTLANQCQNDAELQQFITKEYFDILKFLILANKSHIIALEDPSLKITECSESTIQFLLTIATPEFEKAFQIKKKKYGNKYLWHGSNVVRWYSILHNGLKDLGRTVDRVHAGPIYGDGIYQSNLSSYSIPYSYVGVNRYKNSTLPNNLQVLSLTENAKTPGLNHPIEFEYTQTDERACIIRCLMVVKNNFSWDIVKNPPKYIPSLNDVLRSMTKESNHF